MNTEIILIVLSLFSGLIAGFGGSSAFIPIAGLISLTSFTQTQISGTIATSFFIATLFGSLLYTKSGDQNRNLLIMIVPPGLIGTQLGVFINNIVSEVVFTVLTALIALVLGGVLLQSSRSKGNAIESLSLDSKRGKILLIALGLVIGIVAGVTGIGGIPIVVPVLIILGVNHMTSIATGFTVATFNTFGTSVSYIAQDTVQFEYVLYIGVPFAIAQIVGWKLARNIDISGLKVALGVFNVLLGLYLITSI